MSESAILRGIPSAKLRPTTVELSQSPPSRAGTYSYSICICE